MEFDNSNRLKLRSIAKLLQFKADIAIGIVRGKKDTRLLEANKERIQYIMDKLSILDKSILLLILNEKASAWIIASEEKISS